MNDEKARLCVECRHCNWPEFATGNDAVIDTLASCHHPMFENRISYVVGPINSHPCWATRQTGACGDAGHLFERSDAKA